MAAVVTPFISTCSSSARSPSPPRRASDTPRRSGRTPWLDPTNRPSMSESASPASRTAAASAREASSCAVPPGFTDISVMPRPMIAGSKTGIGGASGGVLSGRWPVLPDQQPSKPVLFLGLGEAGQLQRIDQDPPAAFQILDAQPRSVPPTVHRHPDGSELICQNHFVGQGRSGSASTLLHGSLSLVIGTIRCGGSLGFRSAIC